MTLIYGLFIGMTLITGGLMVNHSVNPPTNQRADLCYGLNERYCKEEYKHPVKHKPAGFDN